MGSQTAGAGVARNALNGWRMPDLAPAALAATVAVQLGAVPRALNARVHHVVKKLVEWALLRRFEGGSWRSMKYSPILIFPLLCDGK
jgi:hypothetical protein